MLSDQTRHTNTNTSFTKASPIKASELFRPKWPQLCALGQKWAKKSHSTFNINFYHWVKINLWASLPSSGCLIGRRDGFLERLDGEGAKAHKRRHTNAHLSMLPHIKYELEWCEHTLYGIQSFFTWFTQKTHPKTKKESSPAWRQRRNPLPPFSTLPGRVETKEM